MRAAQIAEEYPVVAMDTDASDAAWLLAQHRLPGIVVTDGAGAPQAVLPASQVVRFIVPQYVQDDPSLAAVLNESMCDQVAAKLRGKKVRDVIPERLSKVPPAKADDTIIEVAAVMARLRCPLIAVMKGNELVGVITASRLLEAALQGRVSTEDQQDPEASRNWQRARALTDRHGEIVAEFFDVGQSRSIPWKRRPQATRLLEAIRDPDRGFDAVVIGEPQRAFYGNQYGLTFPVLTHYGLQLWVPEVGGAVDPDSEAHDLVMSVFGGMSKGERNRIKIRVRAAMAAQASVEGRFLGGRPPYGYRLADAGPHPNPAKAADGKRLHRLETDPVTAPIVRRIFAEYLGGRGIYGIAEALTRDDVASPSAYDPARNRHRPGVAWSKGAIRVILSNPRYTGRQVWNKQRKDEILIDVEDIALGHETRMRWNDRDQWVFSDQLVHDPIIDTDTFERAQQVLAAKGAGRRTRERHRTHHTYMFRGRLRCGLCQRRMQGQRSRDMLLYRCRYPNEYALANKVVHPRNVYLAERDLLGPLDDWLGTCFAPHRVAETIDALYRAQPDHDLDPSAAAVAQAIEDCDRILARHRAALEAGADPHLVAHWMAEVQARRAEALARSRPITRQRRMTSEEIGCLIKELGDIRHVLSGADPLDKAEVYRHLNLQMTYHPAKRLMRVETSLDPHS